MLGAYSLALGLGVVLAAPVLAARLLNTAQRPAALARVGLGPLALPPKAAAGGIWLHALSVGEFASALPLLTALRQRFPARPLAVSLGTAQGLAVARERLAGLGLEPFVRPLEVPWVLGRVLERLRPALALLVEGDIWPGWQMALGRRGVPRLLVNGRVSPRTFARYQRLAPLTRGLLAGFDQILAQTRTDQERLLAVGVPPQRVQVAGNLKFDSAPARLEAAARERLAAELGLAGRLVLVAGSTHPGEEEPCLQAYAALVVQHPGLALLLAPRQVERGPAVLRLARQRGLSAAALSSGPPPPGVQVVVLDVLGRLAGAYALARAAFVGGSLVAVGGHNLLEPAAQGVPVVFGPATHNFLEMAQGLEECGGGLRIAGGADLAAAWGRLLAEPAAARVMGAAASEFVASHRGAVQRAVSAAAALLEGGRV
ncbi:MAG: 3-deoxy-D-manno-octulosonic acid transferase [Desulfarculus sp.]|nr:MAG: 3-deoxy-D-manno-octulosonic acid transferase [Desulfarculus sp.]